MVRDVDEGDAMCKIQMRNAGFQPEFEKMFEEKYQQWPMGLGRRPYIVQKWAVNQAVPTVHLTPDNNNVLNSFSAG